MFTNTGGSEYTFHPSPFPLPKESAALILACPFVAPFRIVSALSGYACNEFFLDFLTPMINSSSHFALPQHPYFCPAGEIVLHDFLDLFFLTLALFGVNNR